MPEVYDKFIKRTACHYLRRLTKKQQETLRKFDEYNEVKNWSLITRENQIKTIGHLGDDVKKEYQDMVKFDVNQWLMNKDITNYSRLTYQLHLQKFFKWLGNDVEDWFETIENAYDKIIKPSELWSPEEIDALIKVYPEVQYRALVATLFDSEARVSEFCSVSIEDVEFIAGNAIVFFPDSKTEKRRVELIFATKELLPWYNLRKAQARPTDPLWISKCNRNKNQRLSKSGVYEILKYGTKLLGTDKHLHPHLLRHSMASYLRAKGYPDALHRIRMGLGFNSPVLDRYSHFQDSQIGEGAKKAFGVKDIQPVKEEVNPLIGKLCPRCSTLNRTADTLCSKCFYSIDYENTGMELELLEMFRSEFCKVTNLDVLFHDYRMFKTELNLLEQFKTLLQGRLTIETEIVKRYFVNAFKLTDEDVIHFIESLMQEGVGDVEGDFIVLTSIEKLDDLIQSCRKFVELDSKYKISKEVCK